MNNISPVTLATLQAHEAKREPPSNVKLGGYHMPPADQFTIYQVTFDAVDLGRLCVLNDFARHTVGGLGYLEGIQPAADFRERVQKKLAENIDLRHDAEAAPVFVCPDFQTGQLTVIDGNHRLTAHYLKFQAVSDVVAYVCVHPQIVDWGFLPPAARQLRG